MSSVVQLQFQTTRPRSQVHIRQESVLFFVLVVLTFLLRFSVISYNTLFYDEAVNATLGREVLSGDFTQNATSWTFGSYLYPMAAALADQVGGELGIRFLCALLSTISTILVFLTALRLFGIQPALWAMGLFSITGASISLGQLAVYDSLGVPLLAAALYCMVRSAFSRESRISLWLVAAGVFASFSVLSKYIGGLFLPALFLTGFLLYQSQGRKVRPLFLVFVPVVLVILGAYGLYYKDDLTRLLRDSRTLLFVLSDRPVIISTILEEAGITIAIAILGVFFLPRARFGFPGVKSRKKVLWLAALMAGFLVATMAAPIYQIISSNIQSLWKHTVYGSLYLAPLAGYGLATTINALRGYSGRWAMGARAISAVVTLVVLVWYTNYSLDRNWGIQHSWPNASHTIDYLRSQEPNKDTRILAEQSAVYEYYFDMGAYDRDVWTNTFYMEYRGAKGLDGMVYGIRDHYFDYVILDDYYTPDKDVVIKNALRDAGYVLAFQDPTPQVLSTGQAIVTEVYRWSE